MTQGAPILHRYCAQFYLAQYRCRTTTWALCASNLQFLRNFTFCVNACIKIAQKKEKNLHAQKNGMHKKIRGWNRPRISYLMSASLTTKPPSSYCLTKLSSCPGLYTTYKTQFWRMLRLMHWNCTIFCAIAPIAPKFAQTCVPAPKKSLHCALYSIRAFRRLGKN